MIGILKGNKTAAVIVGIALLAAAIMGGMAWRAKARADQYRARIDVLEKTIQKIREDIQIKDREWKRKLSDAEKRYKQSEERWAEAMSKFGEWKPGTYPVPKSAQETIDRLKALGISGKTTRGE